MSVDSLDATGRFRILIVEDDGLQMQILDAGLTAAGFEVDWFGGGLDAVWKVTAGHYDVILVDYHLPELDGLAIARLVGDFSEEAARPIVIALTATPELVKARDSEPGSAFDAILGKTTDLTSLLGVIEQQLASAPDRATRRTAEAAQLERMWSAYDMERQRPGAIGDDPGPIRILVVEDDDAQGLLLTSVLRDRGYDVETSPTGLDAVRRMWLGTFDLAIVDYSLPDFDGLPVAKLVHNLMEQEVRPRLVAFTATPHRLVESEATGTMYFDGVVRKSADFSGLMDLVDRLLQSSPNSETRRAVALALSKTVPVARPASVAHEVDAAVAFDGIRPPLPTTSVTGQQAGSEGSAAVSIVDAVPFNPVTQEFGSELAVLDAGKFNAAAAYIASPVKVSFYMQSIAEQCEALQLQLRQSVGGIQVAANLADGAHRLAGSAGMFGFDRVASIALSFEQAVRTSGAEVPTLTGNLIAALEASLWEIRNKSVLGGT